MRGFVTEIKSCANPEVQPLLFPKRSSTQTHRFVLFSHLCEK